MVEFSRIFWTFIITKEIIFHNPTHHCYFCGLLQRYADKEYAKVKVHVSVYREVEVQYWLLNLIKQV
ncbi:hypothetical protein FRX31_029486 [Thalictrum thalictroides]|uniref:Uncharacterized protein n=1 Tax=Thalictrum thalictroides TaxID=46969 RepID=A0A7J6V9R8_THATH|nr:hypothetical protein FRX31_029486 [Thalictrum thalictroides]